MAKIERKGVVASEYPPDDKSWIGNRVTCNRCGTRIQLEDGDVTGHSYEYVRGYSDGYAPIRVIPRAYCPICGKLIEIRGKKYRLEEGEWKRVRF